MIQINNTNVDKWLFDYFEGELSAIEKLNVDTFIQNNPVHQSDFDAWQNARISNNTPTQLSPSFKKSLRKASKGIFSQLNAGIGSIVIAVAVIIGIQFLDTDEIIPTDVPQDIYVKKERKQDKEFKKVTISPTQEQPSPTLAFSEPTNSKPSTLNGKRLETYDQKIALITEFKKYENPRVKMVRIRFPHKAKLKKKLTFREHVKVWQETKGSQPNIIEMDSDLF